MKQQATFVGWDFVNTWRILEDESYPYLSWSSQPVRSIHLLTQTDTGICDSDKITNKDNSSADKKLGFRAFGTVSDATVTLYYGGQSIASAVAGSTSTDIQTNGSVDLADGPGAIIAGTTIGDVKISNNLTDSLILGAYSLGANGQYEYGGGDYVSGYTIGTSIKSVTVGGTMSGTSIAANVLCGPDHYFSTGDDVILAGSLQAAIKAVSLKGRTDTTETTDTFAIMGQGTGGTLKIGGVKINMPTTQGDTVFRF